jgi:predicted pyridoxine 5'-phosphate oxidase superfamily flavin-nucleotide-binding protein
MSEKVHDYHEGNRYFQDRFDTRRLADRLAENSKAQLGDSERDMIERADMFFLATCDDRGLPTVSYKGGDPGFVRVLDDEWIAFPNYDGNGKYQSMGNLLKTPNVGMLFVDFENQRRLRLQGVATILDEDELVSEYVGAQFVVRVKLTEVYGNCPRYVHKYQLVERSKFVPRASEETPIPDWKLREDMKGLLPAGDSARDLARDSE